MATEQGPYVIPQSLPGPFRIAKVPSPRNTRDASGFAAINQTELKMSICVLALVLTAAIPPVHEELSNRSTQDLSLAPMSYMETQSGQLFRIVSKGPVQDRTGMKIGTRITYLGDSRDHRQARRAATDLVRAIGPQLEQEGEDHVVVLNLLDFVPGGSLKETAIGYPITFALQDHQWRLVLAPLERTKSIGTGAVRPLDDLQFPLDRSALKFASQVADRWIDALDSGNATLLRESACAGYLARPDFGRLLEFLRRRSARRPGAHPRQLYRAQTRSAGPALPASGGIVVVYEVTPQMFGRSIEQVALAQEHGRWCVFSFASRSFGSTTR